MIILEKAADFIKKGEVEIVGIDINKITIQVKDNLVTFQRKAGRVEDSCSCINHSKFNQINPRCAHKLAAATFLVMRKVKWK